MEFATIPRFNRINNKTLMEINKAMSLCLKNGIKVYPVQINRKKIFIESDKNGKVTRYKKVLDNIKDINKAIESTYIFLAEKTNK